jgi:NifB/MoaA-like Fe-S oxidoreductase
MKIIFKILEKNNEHIMVKYSIAVIIRWRVYCQLIAVDENNDVEAITKICRCLRSIIPEPYWKLTSAYLGFSCP